MGVHPAWLALLAACPPIYGLWTPPSTATADPAHKTRRSDTQPSISLLVRCLFSTPPGRIVGEKVRRSERIWRAAIEGCRFRCPGSRQPKTARLKRSCPFSRAARRAPPRLWLFSLFWNEGKLHSSNLCLHQPPCVVENKPQSRQFQYTRACNKP